MVDILRNNNKIIINSDIDGILSGLILQHFLGCEIVGFCNSDNKIWISQHEIPNYKKFVFIDMYVNNPEVTCIDQHIISFNKNHNELISKQPNKINPNVIRGRYFYPSTSYFQKYPFGTVHFIIANLEKNGFDLGRIFLFNEGLNIQPIEYFLRADDAFHTSVNKYPENAKDWWKWLSEYSGNGSLTNTFIEYVYSGLDALKSKRSVESKFLSSPFFCKKPDGGFLEILDDENRLLPNIKEYINFIADSVNLPRLVLTEDFKILQGIPKRINFTHSHYEEFCKSSTICGHKVFSYAFVKSFGRENSFSFTYFSK